MGDPAIWALTVFEPAIFLATYRAIKPMMKGR
jgi:hypothetical protein